VVEGQTEETFVRELIAPFFGEQSVFVDAHRVTTGRKGANAHRGGFVKYAHLRRDLELWMKEDQQPESWFTTMVDLYGLPSDFPGFGRCSSISRPIERARCLENELKSDLDHPRFVPYLQLHEFEALLFSDPQSFLTAFPNSLNEVAELDQIRRGAGNPEQIDDGPETAPSKRISNLLPQYTKAVHGPIIAREITLAKIRRECKHFDEWVDALLSLSCL